MVCMSDILALVCPALVLILPLSQHPEVLALSWLRYTLVLIMIMIMSRFRLSWRHQGFRHSSTDLYSFATQSESDFFSSYVSFALLSVR